MAQHWAKAPIERNQIVLFSPTLEDAISEDHPVRLLDEILRGLDWSEWVTPCGDHRGRPPIHSRILAAIILYGLMRRIRSSRTLEYMCGHNVDFIWLAEGHRPDHGTLSGFRKESGKALKGLFRQVGRKEGKDPEKNPAQLPKADTDSKVMPNKEGGYAANFAPTAAVDVSGDMIVDCEVIADPNEHTQTLAAVDRIEGNFGKKPEAFLADTAHGTGENLAGMQQRNVTFLTPMESSQPQEGNPARRDDPSQPIAETDWPRLPRNSQKQLDKSCFVYVEASQCYYCPQGRRLEYAEIHRVTRNGQEVAVRVYRCANCENCPLSVACRSSKARRGRMIYRDPYEPLREEMAARMQTAEGRATYAHRMHGAETPFAYIKAVMGVRQFLLRGLENVRTEWRWVCTAFNLRKLLNAVAALCADLSQGTAGAVD